MGNDLCNFCLPLCNCCLPACDCWCEPLLAGGKITREQVEGIFKKLDKDGDGKLAGDELLRLLEILTKAGVPKKMIDAAPKLDKDGDKKISLGEIIEWLQNLKESEVQSEPKSE